MASLIGLVFIPAVTHMRCTPALQRRGKGQLQTGKSDDWSALGVIRNLIEKEYRTNYSDYQSVPYSSCRLPSPERPVAGMINGGIIGTSKWISEIGDKAWLSRIVALTQLKMCRRDDPLNDIPHSPSATPTWKSFTTISDLTVSDLWRKESPDLSVI
ncbi:16091_t:CDS:2 [Acaulospora colombiana]|uniref:16091_t:CDS:1 n=1 Tax=Acaulospora colombiana TaxID=27376 RepID=A0ACA9MT56_9GLOM|nr:16091_t:CDS:2 [Acaulospora colombiana]